MKVVVSTSYHWTSQRLRFAGCLFRSLVSAKSVGSKHILVGFLLLQLYYYYCDSTYDCPDTSQVTLSWLTLTNHKKACTILMMCCSFVNACHTLLRWAPHASLHSSGGYETPISRQWSDVSWHLLGAHFQAKPVKVWCFPLRPAHVITGAFTTSYSIASCMLLSWMV